MADWEFDVPTAGSKILPPAARAWQAFSSQGYAFNESVTDLVDNCIDARATEVIVHFLRDRDRLVSLVVADNGHGMDEAELDLAMTVGGRHTYEPGALGMFGAGLKSASLSQASSMTVLTRTNRTPVVGRRWVMNHAKSDHRCDIVEPGYAEEFLDRYHNRPITSHGTVVRWDHVKDFPKVGDGSDTDRYLDRALSSLHRHLGLYLHRFLVRDKFAVHVIVEEVNTRVVYRYDAVEPLDPLDYPVSGSPAYPRRFIFDVDGVGPLPMTAHIWTPKSSLAQYKSIGPVVDRQGFYLYRNDRLVQAGGWNGLRQTESHLALARVSLDIPIGHDDVFRVTVKKSGVETSPAFAAALRRATAEDGSTTFDEYLRVAEAVYRDARKHGPKVRKESVPIGKGMDPAVHRILSNELEFMAGSTPISFRWRDLEGDDLFEFDRDEHTVWFNSRYRKAISAEKHGGINDMPLVKALVYLLFYSGGIFTSDHLGPRDKDNLELWQAVLSAAAQAELKRRQVDG